MRFGQQWLCVRLIQTARLAMHDSAIVELFSAADAADAYAIKNLLEDDQITARVVGDWIQTGVGEIPVGIVTAPRIWVLREDAVRAKQLLTDFLAMRRHDTDEDVKLLRAATWTCPVCGEQSPSNFGVCWNCEFDHAQSTESSNQH